MRMSIVMKNDRTIEYLWTHLSNFRPQNFAKELYVPMLVLCTTMRHYICGDYTRALPTSDVKESIIKSFQKNRLIASELILFTLNSRGKMFLNKSQNENKSLESLPTCHFNAIPNSYIVILKLCSQMAHVDQTPDFLYFEYWKIVRLPNAHAETRTLCTVFGSLESTFTINFNIKCVPVAIQRVKVSKAWTI